MRKKNPLFPFTALYFSNGKIWPNERPGLRVELDAKPLKLVGEFTERYSPTKMFHRPDGLMTNW